MPDDGKNYVTLGALAAAYQQSVPKLQKILDGAGVAPAFRLNGVPHYGEDVYDALDRAFGGRAPAAGGK
jgi:hypothetical protein